MPKNKPGTLKLKEEQFVELKKAIVVGIKQKVAASMKLIEINKEVAAGIHVYSIEELGKLLLLSKASKLDNYRIIKYDSEFLSHRKKFEAAFEYLNKIGRARCIVIRRGSFSSSFSSDSFTIDVFADTQARLGVFYCDLKYSLDNDISNGMKKIPSVDSEALRTAIECLENLSHQNLDEFLN